MSHPWLDGVMPQITNLHTSPYIFPLIALVIWRLASVYGAAGLRLFLLALLTVGVCDFSATQVFKHNVARARPFEIKELKAIKRTPADTGQSFVSNHAANTFAVAAFIGSFLPGTGFFLFIIAALVAFSRVYCGVHFPSDVIVGGIWGILVGTLLAIGAQRLGIKRQQDIV